MMHHAKRWVWGFLAVMISLIMVNYVIWKTATKDILTFDTWYNGDLARMGYVSGSKHYRKPENTLPRRHIDGAAYSGQRIDLLTMGDSFSNMSQNGRDPLYQDWIASLYGLEVLNLLPYQNHDKIASLLILANSGYLDRIRPKVVILESAERYCITEHMKDYDPAITAPINEVERFYKKDTPPVNPPKPSFLNTGNFKFLLYSGLYLYSDNAFISKVHMRELDRPFFTVKNASHLLFYNEDVKFIPAVTKKTVATLNKNLNLLSDVLHKKGISLVFMPAPDKYNIYSNYIVNNPYPKSVFFELMREIETRRYTFVDTKALLLEEVQKGELDIYYADDTHWSWKAVKKIASSLNLRSSGIL